jgi:hypothetical protein
MLKSRTNVHRNESWESHIHQHGRKMPLRVCQPKQTPRKTSRNQMESGVHWIDNFSQSYLCITWERSQKVTTRIHSTDKSIEVISMSMLQDGRIYHWHQFELDISTCPHNRSQALEKLKFPPEKRKNVQMQVDIKKLQKEKNASWWYKWHVYLPNSTRRESQ